MKRVFCLYGIDGNGVPLCMYFQRKSHLRDFVESVPGTYSYMRLEGIAYDDFKIGSIFTAPAPSRPDWIYPRS